MIKLTYIKNAFKFFICILFASFTFNAYADYLVYPEYDVVSDCGCEPVYAYTYTCSSCDYCGNYYDCGYYHAPYRHAQRSFSEVEEYDWVGDP